MTSPTSARAPGPPLSRFPSGHVRSTGVSSAFGTFGELLQGMDIEGTNFLVTLPIACWTTARFTTNPDSPGIRVSPPHKHKAVRLARAMLSAAGYRGGGSLELRSAIPEGKGLASSSADLVATARAIANALGVRARASTIEALLRAIEPSDGVMHDAVTAFNHLRVTLRARLGALPPLAIVAVDEGGMVDTVGFNRRAKPFSESERREYTHLLDVLMAAVAAGDVATVGSVATRSAELNQRLHFKHTLADLRAAAERIGGLGVVVAHSGTVLGILLAEDDPGYRAKRELAEQACRAVSGGVAVYHSLSFQRCAED